MQLGELQSQLSRFKKRGVSVVAISVDPLSASNKLVKRLQLSFALASDQNQKVMQAYGVQNQSTQALAIHAVFIVANNRQVIYRKVASRRPQAQELLDAIDYYYGRYPANDAANDGLSFTRAYPQNNFQTLLEIAATSELPAAIASNKSATIQLAAVAHLLKQGKTDDSIIAFRQMLNRQAKSEQREDYLRVAAYLVRAALNIPPEAIAAGKTLSTLLNELRQTRSQSSNPQHKSIELLQKSLAEHRAKITRHARQWRLSYAKAMLRSYRELVITEIPE
ncbi:MAG: peroxiredoxin family protein [Pseudomonadales bacterium]|nr:peroxiredoxin family protein [Pseudomonadales bacterium]